MSPKPTQTTPQSIPAPAPYQNRFMAPNDFSEIHLNAYQTDTTSVIGPASKGVQNLQQVKIAPPGIAGSLAFNKAGQIVTIRVGADNSQELLLLDPARLNVIARTELPRRSNPTGQVSFSGGGYFYLNAESQVVCVTADAQIRIYRSVAAPPGPLPFQFDPVRAIDLSGVIASDDILNSVLPDSDGNLWFISHAAVVGYAKYGTADIEHITIPSIVRDAPTITKSFATDGDRGVYVVTDQALYRFEATPGGPKAIWHAVYDAGTRTKLGQNQRGSGTTPTCFDDSGNNKFVTITDNADPLMHVNVYDRKTGRLVAQQEVFQEFPYISSCENSLIAVNHSIIVENNFNNVNTQSTLTSLTTVPGVNRVDFDPSIQDPKKNARVVWENNSVAIPSVVSQLSTGDGCIYTYAKSPQGWYWAALDYNTGKIRAQTEIVPWSNEKDGSDANNFYSGLGIGPDGTAYVGVFGGIVAWRGF
jgi:hypothetical protein